MLAVYAGAAWADDQAEAQLLAAWVRRKQFEARLIAIEVGRLFSGVGDTGSERVSADQLLNLAGVNLG